jgi:ABC-type branched-subunit amino acid transport system substrate-binding protein
VARAAVREVDPEDRATQAGDLVEDLLTERPDTVLYAGAATREAEPVLGALGEQLGAAPVLAGPQLVSPTGFAQAPAKSCAFTAAKLPASASQRANALLRAVRGEGLDGYEAQALLAYDATRLALQAIEDGGSDRQRVISAARRPDSRSGLFGPYSIDRRGDAAGRSIECVDLATGS